MVKNKGRNWYIVALFNSIRVIAQSGLMYQGSLWKKLNESIAKTSGGVGGGDESALFFSLDQVFSSSFFLESGAGARDSA